MVKTTSKTLSRSAGRAAAKKPAGTTKAEKEAEAKVAAEEKRAAAAEHKRSEDERAAAVRAASPVPDELGERDYRDLDLHGLRALGRPELLKVAKACGFKLDDMPASLLMRALEIKLELS